jgi:DNA-binding beta-propeller fold protein YncE
MAEGRHIGLNARSRGLVVATALAALALAVVAPRATGVPMPGPAGTGAAAALGADVSGLAFDAEGRLYAADLHGGRVVVLGPGDEVLATVGAGRLDRPTGVAVAPGGDVLVSDHSGVTRFAPGGAPVAAWAADEAAGLAIGADGTVYVSEPERVALFTAAGAPLGAFPATHPRGIAVAADGTLWVAVDDGVAHVTAAGAPIATTPADHAEGVAVAPDRTVLVAERERDRLTRIAPDGALVGTVEDAFDEPRGVAVDCRGDVAVADDSPARIHRLPAAGAPPPPCLPAAAVVAAPEPPHPVTRRLVATPAPASVLLPALGRTALAATASGDILVRAPGAAAPSLLRAGTLVPMGARVDARDGRVTLRFATRTADFDTLGTTQTGAFEAGVFAIAQRRRASLVELRLAGARPRCRLPASAGPLGPRHLWADVRGRFRTRGALATATAHSARWLTEDRCDGTLVRVVRGSVRVRDLVRGRTVTVRAGGRLLVRPRARG